MVPPKIKGKEGQSRNGTPLSVEIPDSSDGGPSTSPMSTANISYGDILDQYCRGSSPPASATLKRIADALKICSDVAKDRSDFCDKAMRETLRRKQELVEVVREQELEEKRIAEEQQDQLRQAALKHQQESARPPAVGAHSLARQDGKDSTDAIPTMATSPGDAGEAPAPSPSPTEIHQPRPAPLVPQVQTFGEDPTSFDDPTIYHIRDVHADMTEEEKKEILNVAEYPHSNLYDLTPGTPPHRDFSNFKSDNRVTQSQFATYVEPWVRQLTQEDLAFLEERGDRSGPFVIPRRGPRHYQEIWDEEDGITNEHGAASSQQPSTNRPFGSIEHMNDEAAENGEISAGPMTSRLLATLIPEQRAPAADTASNNANGDASASTLNNGEPAASTDRSAEDQKNQPYPPATFMPESSQPGWKAAPPKMDYITADDRLKAELRYIGFLPEDAEPDYDGHHDDEVAARLRYLQEELQRVSLVNGAHKARVQEIAEQRMASQEWSTIADDLDTQINQAYQKRHRNIGKGKKPPKRPGGPGGGSHPSANGIGVSKPGIGEPIRALIERRKDWHRVLGPLVDHGRNPVPTKTIFDQASMDRLMAKEREQWSEAQDQT